MRQLKVFGPLIFPITAVVVLIIGFVSHLQSLALGLLALCVALTVAQSVLAVKQAGAGSLRIEQLRDDYQSQLMAATQKARQNDPDFADRTTQIRSLESELAARQKEIETLRADADAQRQVFEAEARRLTEQVFRALSGQVEAHSRQLEAVNMAMQYQRADLQQVRRGMRSLASDSESHAIQQIPPAVSDEVEPDSSEGLFQTTVNAPSTVVVEMPIYEIGHGNEMPFSLPDRHPGT